MLPLMTMTSDGGGGDDDDRVGLWRVCRAAADLHEPGNGAADWGNHCRRHSFGRSKYLFSPPMRLSSTLVPQAISSDLTLDLSAPA